MMIPMILLAILTWLALGYIGSRLALSYLERGTDIPLDKDNYTMATIFMVFGLLNFLVGLSLACMDRPRRNSSTNLTRRF